MSMFENTAQKISEALGVVAATTEKAVDIGKKKYNIAALKNKLEKQYALLGKLYYESNNTADASLPYKAYIDEISHLISQIENEEKILENIKK